ncbi:hypothetical protein GZH53_06560 [Flavihumibacter sp. R14]|nr:hypothetical protein [Flavihumibacter soli]
MNRAFSLSILLLSCFSLLIVSCEKETTGSLTPDTSVGESAFATEISTNIFLELNGFLSESRGLFTFSKDAFQVREAGASISSCINVSITPADSWPKTMTIDFGEGCTTGNVTRKGKMIAVFYERFQNPGAHITLSFENFQIGDHKIEGTQIITNNGLNAAGIANFTHEIPSLKIISPDKTIYFSSHHNIAWIEGSGTLAPADDVFSISGTASGVNSAGQEFSAAILASLIRKVACSYIVSGSTLIKSGGSEMTIDYGSGDCDDKALINNAGEVKQISLSKR